jgi:four helix bundle protein
MNGISSFEDLDCWKLCTELRREVIKVCKKFPEHEKFMLVSQMKRCSRSVTANISEGYGRFHYQENIQYCRQSRGSLYELKEHFYVARDEEYITEVEIKEYKEKTERCIAVINGYINYLKKKKESG